MAIYRTGTASMNAAGVVTGVGTKWKDSLSLIRVGATIVFLTNPLNLATISAIVSDTELRVITNDAAAVPAGTKYVILLHDSITVDGLAQDVAETLRYYQGKESEIAEAIEFFETFDFDKLKLIGDQVKADAASAAQSKDDAAASQQAALTSSVAAGQARDQAQSANTAAQQANTAAQGAKTDAIAARDAARQYADSVNPALLLHSANNLNDVANKAQSLQNLQDGKPLTLVADPINQYDAATKRWTENLIGAGTAGPTMNGVMNFGVGQITLWHSRAYMPPYLLAMDGQIVNRADWPELWAHAQQHGAISDSAWVGDKTQRGRFSTGNGSTTFRLPDLNGVQTKGSNGFTGEDSIRALFGRGDSGGGLAGGTVSPPGAPNITGNFNIRYARASNGFGAGIYLSGEGSIYGETINASANSEPMQLASQGTTAFQRINIDAARSSSVYGGTTTEIRTNNFAGVWVVRASGGFVAANTQWDVINSDATAPGNGTYVLGGRVRSTYKIGSAVELTGGMRVGKTIGESGKGDLTLFTSERSGSSTIDSLYSLKGPSGSILTDVQSGWMTNSAVSGINDANAITFNGLYAGAGAAGINWSDPTAPLLHMSRASGNTQGQLQIGSTGTLRIRGGTGAPVTWSAWQFMQAQGTSGREFKKDITPSDPKEALARIISQDLVTFVYKDDEKERVRFGFIAEDAEKIAPQYIKHDEETVEVDGEVITRDHPRVDTTPIVMDLMGCIHALQEQIEDLKFQIQELKK